MSYSPKMDRSVAQLLFTYLPERTVDWENGAAIVLVASPRLGEIWSPARSKLVIEEISKYSDRWRNRGGRVDQFPNLSFDSDRVVIGTPTSADSKVFMTALVCSECNHLAFNKRAYLQERKYGPRRRTCSACKKRTLRQIGQVFVHGCGAIEPISSALPMLSKDKSLGKNFIFCSACQSSDSLKLEMKSERASGMQVICAKCKTVALDRFLASCPECIKYYQKAESKTDSAASGAAEEKSPLAKRVLMRLTRHSASEAYYAHSTTILRLGRVPNIRDLSDEMLLLQNLLPPDDRPESKADPQEALEELLQRASQAKKLGQTDEHKRLLLQISSLASTAADPGSATSLSTGETKVGLLTSPDSDLRKNILESQALLQEVQLESAFSVAQRGSGASNVLKSSTEVLLRALGIKSIEYVKDLPIVSASFGFTRRSFEPIYEELGERLQTSLRPFPPLDDKSGLAGGRRDLAGKVPILAREGEHEGLFIRLDEDRVLEWLDANKIKLPASKDKIVRILNSLEPIDRYYDDIWEKPNRRMIFGLIHTLSHVAMRAASFYAGLDRTSIAEYIFLPLLGTVVYASSTGFKFGGMESIPRDNLLSFVKKMEEEASTCIYDPDCLDRKSACHGCIHSPEISCRVFNHGLARSFLLGGNSPWAAGTTKPQNLVGYWQLGGGK